MSKIIYSKEHKYIVEQLRKARKEADFSQKKIAKILRKTQSYVSKIKSGQRKIDIVQLKEFAKVYKKKLNFFIK